MPRRRIPEVFVLREAVTAAAGSAGPASRVVGRRPHPVLNHLALQGDIWRGKANHY